MLPRTCHVRMKLPAMKILLVRLLHHIYARPPRVLLEHVRKWHVVDLYRGAPRQMEFWDDIKVLQGDESIQEYLRKVTCCDHVN